MRKCGASAMQPPPDPGGDVGVRAACPTGVVSTASKSLSRLRPWQRRLFRWRLMMMQSSSPERGRSSSACKSVVMRLATHSDDDTRCADGGRECAASEHECAGSSALPRRFACPSVRRRVDSGDDELGTYRRIEMSTTGSQVRTDRARSWSLVFCYLDLPWP
jgi:hypothetical protein